jgi:hypothetical protein
MGGKSSTLAEDNVLKTSKSTNTFNSEDNNSFEALKLLLDHFKEKYGLPYKDILSIIDDKKEQKIELEKLPISIFKIEKLSCLEIIVKYLKENHKQTFSEVASLLNRDQRTIWVTYHNSLKKQPKSELLGEKPEFFVPVKIFRDRKFGVLEAVVLFMKEEMTLSFSQISILLNKNYRTVWTSYNKAKKKNKNEFK